MPPNIDSYFRPFGRKSKKVTTCEPDNSKRKELLDMQLESNRLKTYENWKNDAVTPKELAKAGFYFMNVKYDAVKCAYCGTEICRWEPNDNPLQEHAMISPACPFVKEKGKELRVLPALFNTIRPGRDVCSMGSTKSTSYTNLQDRLKTFSKWPKSSKQKPEELAEAGFLYSGIGDKTICFTCGGELRDWEDDDDPWEQHAFWYPRCEFVEASKGQEFIKEMQRKFGGNPGGFDSNPQVTFSPCVDCLHQTQPPLTTGC